jgi:hypothetical protein
MLSAAFIAFGPAYGVVRGLRWPRRPHDTQAASIFRQALLDTAIRSLHADGFALGFDLQAEIVASD